MTSKFPGPKSSSPYPQGPEVRCTYQGVQGTMYLLVIAGEDLPAAKSDSSYPLALGSVVYDDPDGKKEAQVQAIAHTLQAKPGY